MDVSSEMIHSLLPVFLVGVLGAGAAVLGLVEGLGEVTASVSKLGSGWLSDRLGRRKTLTTAGYALSALSKPLFALAASPAWILVARTSDRIGKGIRGAPRDALIGDLAPADLRGAAFGLRQSLDTVGAFVGPLLALALMLSFDGNFRLVFWLALVPGLIAVAILVFAVHEPAQPQPARAARAVVDWRSLTALGPAFWGVVGVGAVLTLARVSEAFLVLRAEGAGLPTALVPLTLIVMNAVYAGSAYPLGALSDRVDRWALLAAAFLVLLAADLVLASARELSAVMLGVALWGLHLGASQGLLATLVADAAPASVRGTAFGLFHLVTGVALLLASVVAGILWDAFGPAASFLASAAFTALGLLGLAALRTRRS